MNRYLLTCSCGKEVPVDAGQAGEQIECPACGTRLDVPTLRKLRHFPIAEEDAVRPTSSSGWRPRHGLITSALLVAVAFGIATLWSWLTQPVVPPFDPEARMHAVEHNLENMTPVEGWQLWTNVYQRLPERGFAVFQDPHTPMIEQQIAQRRFFQGTMLAAAAVCLAVALAATLWPRTTPRPLAATR